MAENIWQNSVQCTHNQSWGTPAVKYSFSAAQKKLSQPKPYSGREHRKRWTDWSGRSGAAPVLNADVNFATFSRFLMTRFHLGFVCLFTRGWLFSFSVMTSTDSLKSKPYSGRINDKMGYINDKRGWRHGGILEYQSLGSRLFPNYAYGKLEEAFCKPAANISALHDTEKSIPNLLPFGTPHLVKQLNIPGGWSQN